MNLVKRLFKNIYHFYYFIDHIEKIKKKLFKTKLFSVNNVVAWSVFEMRVDGWLHRSPCYIDLQAPSRASINNFFKNP